MRRRQWLIGTTCSLLAGCAGASRPASSPGHPALADLEAKVGGRLGVFALDTATGRTLEHRADERFAMCSTFKWVLAAAVLAQVDAGRLSLGDRVTYGPADLMEHAPVTGAHVAQGSMSVEELARAIVTVSDNPAANLLLAKVGGPAGLTEFIRAQRDSVTRLDRNEPALNDHSPGDFRDTTSPRAMVGLMRQVLWTGTLSRSSRERLLSWLRDCETGRKRLRAGLPPDWMVGDKTGSGPRGALNDVAIAWPPGRAPILIAVYMRDGVVDLAQLNAAHAEIGRLVASSMRGFERPGA